MKAITNTGTDDCTYHEYWSGSQLVEERNGSGQSIKDHVWGLGYVDEAVQTRINTTPTSTATWSGYWHLQDANFNELGLVNASGTLVERYEYSAYGQRQVFYSAGSNDPGCYVSTSQSVKVVTSGSVTQPYGINEIGHQGLLHDEELGLVYNRARMLNPMLGGFMQQDPLGYIDSASQFLYEQARSVNGLDPEGLDLKLAPAPGTGTGTGTGAAPGSGYRPRNPLNPEEMKGGAAMILWDAVAETLGEWTEQRAIDREAINDNLNDLLQAQMFADRLMIQHARAAEAQKAKKTPPRFDPNCDPIDPCKTLRDKISQASSEANRLFNALQRAQEDLGEMLQGQSETGEIDLDALQELLWRIEALENALNEKLAEIEHLEMWLEVCEATYGPLPPNPGGLPGSVPKWYPNNSIRGW